MIVYLLRHGDAVKNGSLHDSDRPLSELGRRQASSVGRFLASAQSGIELVLCSPLLRARETAEAVVREIGPLPVKSTEQLTSASNPRDILAEMQHLQSETILVVGHEPHLSETISLLLTGTARSRVEMRPCSLACLTVAKPIKKGEALLHWLRPPGDARQV